MIKSVLKKAPNLSGKTIAITGSTGGLGYQICRYLLMLNAKIILLDRNREKSLKNAKKLKTEYPNSDIEHITNDLADICSTKGAVEELKNRNIDFLILNAAVYKVPMVVTDTGFNNVFQTNFISHYYMVKELLPFLRQREHSGVIVLGSIAHRYSKTNPNNVDFTGVSSCEKVYGNSKRYLMFSLLELFREEKKVFCSVVHPGITFTNITAHYKKWLFALIKYPMKLIFMPPKRAALSVIEGLKGNVPNNCWIGPKFFDIWGKPREKTLKIAKIERQQIFNTAESIYENLAK